MKKIPKKNFQTSKTTVPLVDHQNSPIVLNSLAPLAQSTPNAPTTTTIYSLAHGAAAVPYIPGQQIVVISQLPVSNQQLQNHQDQKLKVSNHNCSIT